MDAKDKEVGRRVSGLRAGLHSAIESYDELIAELQDQPDPRYAQMAEEAQDEARAALDREVRVRGQDHEQEVRS